MFTLEVPTKQGTGTNSPGGAIGGAAVLARRIGFLSIHMTMEWSVSHASSKQLCPEESFHQGLPGFCHGWQPCSIGTYCASGICPNSFSHLCLSLLCFQSEDTTIGFTINIESPHIFGDRICKAPNLDTPLCGFNKQILPNSAISTAKPHHHLIYCYIFLQLPQCFASIPYFSEQPPQLTYLIINWTHAICHYVVVIHNMQASCDGFKTIT